MGDFAFFLVFLIVFYYILWFLIIPKWLFNDYWSIPIFFGWFLELPKCSPNLDPCTPFLSPTYFKKYKNSAGRSLKHIIFISENLKLWKYGKVCVSNFSMFHFWKFENLTVLNLKIWNLRSWILEIRKLASWNNWKFEKYNFGTLLFS